MSSHIVLAYVFNFGYTLHFVRFNIVAYVRPETTPLSEMRHETIFSPEVRQRDILLHVNVVPRHSFTRKCGPEDVEMLDTPSINSHFVVLHLKDFVIELILPIYLEIINDNVFFFSTY